MAGADRIFTASLADELRDSASQFAFFQAVRLIESKSPDSVRVGYQGPTAREAIRFVGNPSLGFPPSDIESIERGPVHDRMQRFNVMVNFLGLYGPDSPLPAFFTEDLVLSDEDGNPVKAFLDLFQHRFVSLFYRCWTKYRYYQEYQPGGADRVSQWLFALMGVLHPAMREGSTLRWPRLLSYTGLIAMRSHSAAMLRGILTHYFRGLSFQVEQCVLRQAWIEADQRVALGTANCTLGRDVSIGRYVPDRSGKFAILIGPMDFPLFETFLPIGSNHPAVGELVRYLLIDQLEFDFRLILLHDEIPDLMLEPENPCRLGWSTWLGKPDGNGEVTLRG